MSEDDTEESEDLATRIETLEEEASIRDEQIRMLEEELAKEQGPDGINGRPFLTDGLPATGYSTGGTLSHRQQEVLNLVYQG
jgi:ATP/maltotriose-dependent transcriptional regulator MalT